MIGAAVAVALLIGTEHADGAEATGADPVGALTEGATNLLSDVDRTLEGAPATLDEKADRTERRLTETLKNIPPPASAVPGLPSLPEPVDVPTPGPDAAPARPRGSARRRPHRRARLHPTRRGRLVDDHRPRSRVGDTRYDGPEYTPIGPRSGAVTRRGGPVASVPARDPPRDRSRGP